MTRIEKAVDDFFDDYGCIYNGLNDLQVIWLHGNGVLVSAPWESDDLEDDGDLSVCFESDDYAGFIEAFSIKGNVSHAIKRITVEDVMRLYIKGQASIDCSVNEDSHILWFQKLSNGRMLVTDAYDTKHEITVLKYPKQFISYTKQYYKINRYAKELVCLKAFNAKEKYIVNN